MPKSSIITFSKPFGGWISTTTAGKVGTAPTGTPVGNGAMIYDTTNNKLYIYNGAWKSATFA